MIGIVNIDPFHGIINKLDPGAAMDRITSYTAQTAGLARLSSNADNLGTWTRSDVFSTIPISSRPIRDLQTHGSSSGGIPFYFQTTGGSLSTEWLQEVRLARGSRGNILTLFKSQTTTQPLSLSTRCTLNTCSGCATARLRLLCHAAQNCALSKCVGTVVQTQNVFCGMGTAMKQTTMHAILTWRAMFLSLAEIVLLVVKGLSAETARKTISLKFPTDQFYTLVCSCKDMYASVVALSTSVFQMISSSVAAKTIDFTEKSDIGALASESTMKASSLAGLFFNLITGSTLLPTLAMHRWLMCMVNSSFSEGGEGDVTIKFGDISMDNTWLPCAKIGGLSEILNSGDPEVDLGSVVDAFVSFTLSLMSGIGDTILYALQLSFDSTMDFFIGLVWSVQDILYTYNLKSCKVPNSVMRYVLWCSCNDTAYRIPAAQRAHGIEDGALWCTGTLSMILADGTSSIIFNPYTMQKLSDGVRGVTDYIDCLSSSSSPSFCTAPPASVSSLQVLVDQGVEPIAVWAKCKINYLQSAWDIGAGVLFGNSGGGDYYSNSVVLTEQVRQKAISWAKVSVGEDFLQCMQDTARLQVWRWLSFCLFWVF